MASLPDDAKLLYEQATSKQLKSRISTKFGKLMATKQEKIAYELIREECKKIKDMEEKLTKKDDVDNAAKKTSTTKTADIRETVMNDLSDSAEELEVARVEAEVEAPNAVATVDKEPSLENEAGSSQKPDKYKRKAIKRPLMDIIRENQMAYNRFITKKIPKIMKVIGFSSSENDSD
ncbi:unnamed protein product [Mytilus coruscus]|uniref:Uncharacterized protein n=1 Tax=Mytilus coruscus TaxID=42192 RepID=A0A6J8CN39_MYTCO|nr:unnamed protein product [Mytilus coruscus]